MASPTRCVRMGWRPPTVPSVECFFLVGGGSPRRRAPLLGHKVVAAAAGGRCSLLDRPAPHEVLNSAYLPDVGHIYEPHRGHGFRMWESHDLHS